MTQHWKHLIQRENTSLQPEFKTEIPESIIKKNPNLDPKFLVSTRDYHCLLCKQVVKAGEFHYHDHKKPIPKQQSHLGKRWTN